MIEITVTNYNLKLGEVYNPYEMYASRYWFIKDGQTCSVHTSHCKVVDAEIEIPIGEAIEAYQR